MDDPDAPLRTWNHWLLWDIPRGTHVLEERFEQGSTGQSGTNDFGKPGYSGPCPPRGHLPHRYYFKLQCTQCGEPLENLSLKAGAKRADLDRALKGHMLAEAQYIGRSWGADSAFISKHGELYRRTVAKWQIRKVEGLIVRGQTRQARAEMKGQANPCLRWPFLFLVRLPGGIAARVARTAQANGGSFRGSNSAFPR